MVRPTGTSRQYSLVQLVNRHRALSPPHSDTQTLYEEGKTRVLMVACPLQIPGKCLVVEECFALIVVILVPPKGKCRGMLLPRQRGRGRRE